jgi:hypothetical protein
VTGSGFKAGAKKPVLIMDGVALTMKDLEDDVAVFVVVALLDTVSRDIEMHFDDGLAEGYNTALNYLYFGQKLYSVSPSIGSAGGTKLTLKTAAIGANTNIDGWRIEARINKSWKTICRDFTFVRYGELTCTTTAMQVSARSPIRIRRAASGGSKLWCNNEGGYDDNCRFQQIDSEMTPVVNKIEIKGHPDNSITFEGTGFS